jgi:hypothetical protein
MHLQRNIRMRSYKTKNEHQFSIDAHFLLFLFFICNPISGLDKVLNPLIPDKINLLFSYISIRRRIEFVSMRYNHHRTDHF